ncbi:MAG: hypothetical protein LPK45_11565 [Bacteroidota bacterium]|nr:hypothetical protein [Bacteroidota bacterium]MDX5431744.1 hypothetical protein [Bacteroidota bacterium]MDX5470459.1 hypothetical protein [Bacteroidota bacterium]
MSRSGIRLKQALSILQQLDPGKPLAVQFKALSRQHKEWGGRDRRELRQMLYSWFRMGKALEIEADKPSLLQWSLFLYATEFQSWIHEWQQEGVFPQEVQWKDDFEARKADFRRHWNFEEPFFPLSDAISDQVPLEELETALAASAQTWLRPLPNKLQEIQSQLRIKDISYEVIEGAIGVKAGIDLETLFDHKLARFAEIQDIASQQVIRQLDWNRQRVWDTCAASGGKALQISQEYQPASLLCTDVRPGILENLKTRFRQANKGIPQTQVLDLGQEGNPPSLPLFDAILCDVPCSGSGTFARTPEAMHTMDQERLMHYVGLQERIVRNASRQLDAGAQLLYATCSVYQQENEGHSALFESFGLRLEKQGYFNFLPQGGDVLYFALFKKA